MFMIFCLTEPYLSDLKRKLQKEGKQMNPVLDIFNYRYIQQQAQQHHINQLIEVQKCAKALKDFLDGVDKIEPAYQKTASETFCSIILGYIGRHS